MSENVAQIEIQTIDNTGNGLSSVSTRFDNFGKQLENLEKNLKPVKQILDSGIAIGGSMSGMASLAKNSGNVSAAMEDLKTNLLQIGGAASEAGEKLSEFDGALQNIAKAGAIATQFFTAVRGSVEFGKKLVAGYEAMKVIWAEAQAIKAATATITINTATRTVHNGVVATSSKLLSIETVKVTAVTIAQKAWAAITGVCTTAVRLLNIAMAANPLMFWITALAAVGSAIGIFISRIRSQGDAMEEFAKKAEHALKTIQKNKEHDTWIDDESVRYMEHLELLAQKKNRSQKDDQMAAQMLGVLNNRYKGLNLTLEDAKNGFFRLHKAMAELELERAKKEIEDLSNAHTDASRGGDKELAEKIHKQINEAYVRKKEAEKKITELELEHQQEVTNALNKAQNVREQLNRQIREEGLDARQKELEAVDQLISKEKENLSTLHEKGKLTKEQYDDEIAKLDEVGNKQKKLIEDRFKREAAEEAKRNRDEVQGYADSMKQAFQKTSQDRREEKEDEDFASLMETNPLKAFQFAREKTAQSVNLEQNAKKDWQKTFQEAKKDGVIDEAEKKQLEKAQARYEEALRQRERSESKLKSAQGAIDQNVQDILGKQGAPSGPVDALMKGSMEAFQKETELRNQEKPAEKNIQNIVDILREHFRISENFAVQNRETSDQIRNGLVGV
ncbi:MAG: hypothetical protein J6J31_00095 [Thermoguttaceae bacterium]|nr:hypothetical protein [Thermoguttaceae bacterium]